MSHNRGKVVALTPTALIFGRREKPKTMSKSTVDHFGNLCQSVYIAVSRLKVKVFVGLSGGGGGFMEHPVGTYQTTTYIFISTMSLKRIMCFDDLFTIKSNF